MDLLFSFAAARLFPRIAVMIKSFAGLNLYTEAFLRLIYPAACGVCRAPLELEEKGICSGCKITLKALRFSPEEAAISQNFEFLDGAWALYPYKSPVKEIISGIKFLKKRWLVSVFAEDISEMALRITGDTSYHAVIPVPIHRSRLIEREFNQSELIAARIAESSGVPLRSGRLRKRFQTPPQNQLSRQERKTNLYRAFELLKSQAAEGKQLLLVDDIFTTGATAEETARALKEHGARRVDLFTLARTEIRS